MLASNSGKQSANTNNFQLIFISHSERIIFWIIVLTPLWWLAGIQPLFYPAAIALLLIFNFRVDKLFESSLPACIWAWLAMSIVTIWAAVIGLEETGFNLKDTAAVFVNFLKSYFLVFACFTIPFWSRVRTEIITRAVTWMSIGCLVNLAIQLILLAVGMDNLVFSPPLARLVPGDKSSLMVILANFSPFLGVPLPRTVLHTPDPPILGVVALLAFLICLGETNRRLRRLALIGSSCSLLISFSRLSWLCAILILLTITLLRSPLSRYVGLWLAFLCSLLSSLLEVSFQDFFSKFISAFDSVRSNSSEERALVVAKTLEAWQEKPWLGWGFIRGRVWLYEDTYITLGSFSSYAAVLYINGIVGLAVLIVAMILTLTVFSNPAMSGNNLSQRALAGLISIYISLNATPLSWMAVYLWFFFLWLGALMYEIQQQSSLSSWEQLSRKQLS